jgi:hypothetical protein
MTPDLRQFQAVLGDLDHKRDVYLAVGTYGPAAERYFTNRHQASYLRRYRPDLVPPPAQPGQPPSDHTLGTVFESTYFTDPLFRSEYLRRLRASLQ